MTTPELEITHYSVGNGNFSLLSFGNNKIAIDCGFKRKGGGELIKQIDANDDTYFIATHYDKDHVAGLCDVASVMSSSPNLFIGPDERLYDQLDSSPPNAVDSVFTKTAKSLNQDLTFSHNGATLSIDILFPNPSKYTDPSDVPLEFYKNDGLVVKSTYKYNGDSFEVLFPGDLRRYYLANLDEILRAGEFQADMALIPHHGSVTNLDVDILNIEAGDMADLDPKTSRSIDRGDVTRAIDKESQVSNISDDLFSTFISKVDPDYAVISCKDSGNAQPDKLTLAALENENEFEVYATGVHGDITVEITGSSPSIDCGTNEKKTVSAIYQELMQ